MVITGDFFFQKSDPGFSLGRSYPVFLSEGRILVFSRNVVSGFSLDRSYPVFSRISDPDPGKIRTDHTSDLINICTMLGLHAYMRGALVVFHSSSPTERDLVLYIHIGKLGPSEGPEELSRVHGEAGPHQDLPRLADLWRQRPLRQQGRAE